ncbi:tetratricopeptide repeat-containing sensor histidine kinase [Flavobacterium silvisoli]|uniref:histidine kinase n=1 Tax=Flavobacterium silvisoli TaxID=2529433 RepID=A0A4Q9Z3X8_9FLAO|nr:tetratricopeptide repeat-containing sensor histidine kinase [Flavobacterium silvisoli]TBX71113.1 tetratricopeptide repeat-containing sensor histidine kinase [Flavobacterium silvisoli]
MRKKVIILIPFFLFFYNCNKSNKENTSLKPTKDSLSIYLSSQQNIKISLQDKLKNNRKAFLILKLQGNNLKNRVDLLKVAKNFKLLNQNTEFLKSINYLIEISLLAKDTSSIAKSYNALANHYIDTGKIDSSYVYFVKAEKFFFKTKDSLNLGKNYLEKAYVQVNIGDFSGCEQSSSLSLRYLSKFKDYSKEYFAYNFIAISSNELKNYSNAIIYHKKALNVASTKNLNSVNHYKSVTLNNLGVVYQNLNNHKEAILNFNLALKDENLFIDNPELYTKLYDNLAYSMFKLNRKSEAYKLFIKTYKIADSLNLSTGVINKIHLSEYFSQNKDTIKAIFYSKNALQQAKKLNSSGDVLAALKQLSLIDKKKSSLYYSDYIKLNDSIQQAERITKEKFARIAYETDEIIQEKSNLEEKNRNLLYIFVVSFIVVVLLFVVRAQRARTRELLYKQAQQKANEDIYNLMMSQQAIIDESRNKEKKRLAQDLHDGVLGRMFGLRLNLDSLNHNNDEESIKRRFELLNELKTIEQDIREISHDLNREKQVLINNFVSIVHNLLEEQKSSHDANLIYTIDTSVDWDKVSNNIKINMYRILQEGLQNINKYANAKTITVEVKGDKENVYLKIQDDGVGFDVNRKSKGIGMQNMISRTNDCQGIIDITSKKDHGTKIVITLPIETKQQLITEET